MKRAWLNTTKILTGLFVTAMYAMPQGYTVSAKPGVVNYIEGNAFLNGSPLSAQSLKAVFLNANDTISTDIGKAEVLLAPGCFLRLGDNTKVQMVSPSLADTQIAVKSGSAMVEVDDIVKDSRITVLAGSASIVLDRNGLYRFSADGTATASVLDGKAAVYFGDRKLDVGKGREVALDQSSKARKFDSKRSDDLYAWSNIRAQYNAAASYQAAKDVNAAGYGGVWGGYGFSGYSNPGWFWNSGFNSWSWLPGNGAFYSPFGFGFYGPGVVGYAPVIFAPVYRGGGGGVYAGRGGIPRQQASGAKGVVAGAQAPAAAAPQRMSVPVDPRRPGVVGAGISSPAAGMAARNQAVRSFSSNGGFRTGSGMTVPAGRAAGGYVGGGGARPAPGAGGASVGRAGGGGMSSGGGMNSAGRAGGGAPAAGSAGARH